MTQKLSSEKLVATLLPSIDPGKIAEIVVRQTVELLLNLVEELNSKIKQLEDERKRLTATKISELLLVLDHPELPLHNNPAELAARTMVQRRNISYRTQTAEGTASWDTFMSLVATTCKLGLSFFEYVRDRI